MTTANPSGLAVEAAPLITRVWAKDGKWATTALPLADRVSKAAKCVSTPSPLFILFCREFEQAT